MAGPHRQAQRNERQREPAGKSSQRRHSAREALTVRATGSRGHDGRQSQRRHQRRPDQRRWRADPRGGDHGRRAGEPANDHDESQGREIRPSREQPDRRAQPIAPEVGSRNRREHADVVMGTGAHAVQAERAVHVPGFLRDVQVELASALLGVAAQAIVRDAGGADTPLLQPHLERRDERAHELELPDGADVLAEAGAAEQRVDDEGADEVGHDDPGGPERAVPQRERFVGPEEERQQNDSQPLRSQRPGPVARGESEAASQLARQHERARHAEHVAHREQPDDDEEAPVGPGQHAREIHRAPSGGPRARRR